MTIISLKQMASSRNLLCRPRQGGRGSHENQSSQESFDLSFLFLDCSDQAAENSRLGLSDWPDLADQVSFDPRNRQSSRQNTSGQPAALFERLDQETEAASGS